MIECHINIVCKCLNTIYFITIKMHKENRKINVAPCLCSVYVSISMRSDQNPDLLQKYDVYFPRMKCL